MRRLLVSFGAAALVLSGCGGSSSKSTTPTTSGGTAGTVVDAKALSFHPSTIAIKSGQTVQWTFNDGAIPHNVTGPDFHSKDVTGGTFEHTFTTTGTVHYQCTIHAGMTGTVVVQ